MPHLLIAGTTGSGKSVGINAMVLSLLYKSTAEHVRLIMIDPKMLELSVYEGIPHLLAPVVTDMKQAANALRWCVAEMERRYQLMAALGVRNIAGFNRRVKEAIDAGKPIRDPVMMLRAANDPTIDQREIPDLMPLPYVVVVVDELADLMMIVGKKVEELITRLAQKARASGIHLVLATQRPSVDVITGLIKANIPCRIAFQVSARVDSRTILDQMGAETLLGHGDMLYLPPGTSMPTRVHGAFVSDQEVHRVVEALKTPTPPTTSRRCCRDRRRRSPGLSGEEGEGGGNGRGRGGRSALRRGGAHRHDRAQALDLLRAAAAEDRLQPRGAAARGDGAAPASSARCRRTARATCWRRRRRRNRRCPHCVFALRDGCCSRRRSAGDDGDVGGGTRGHCAAPAPPAAGPTQRSTSTSTTCKTLRATFLQTLADAHGREIDRATRHAHRAAAREVQLGHPDPQRFTRQRRWRGRAGAGAAGPGVRRGRERRPAHGLRRRAICGSSTAICSRSR